MLIALVVLSGLASAQSQGTEPAPEAGQGVAAGTEGEDDRNDRLEARVRELERRLDKEQQEPALQPDPRANVKEATHTTPEGFWKLPGTDVVWKLGGYMKVDVIHDFYAMGNEFKFATQSIAVPEDRESRTTLTAKETRLNVDVRAPIGGHEGRVFVEGDFFTSDSSFHLRHAFGQIGGLLFGQTWTTYMDLSSRPHTLDFEGPDAELFERQVMVRWTQDCCNTSKFSIAIEDANQDLTIDPAFMGSAETPLPDLAVNVRHEGNGWHLQGSGVLRYLHFEGSGGSSDDSTIGWGVALSGKSELGDPGRRLMGQVSYGRGSGNYNQALRGSGSDAVLSPGGSLRALPSYTFVLGYEHDWSERWSSTVAYSRATVENFSSQAPMALERTQSASVNLLWTPFRRFLTGAEYLYGTRENNDGQDGMAHRLQSSFKFTF
jgi:hypothetical protein